MQAASTSRQSKQPCSPSMNTKCRSTAASTSMTAGAANVRCTPRIRLRVAAASFTTLTRFIAPSGSSPDRVPSRCPSRRRAPCHLHELGKEQVGKLLEQRRARNAERFDVDVHVHLHTLAAQEIVGLGLVLLRM